MISKLSKTKYLMPVSIHVMYWMSFIMFFTVVWGTYDLNFYRNFLIQMFGLPAKILLVYITILYIFPAFLLKKKFLQFFAAYILLLIVTGMLIQRPLMIYFVQPNFWPEWQSTSFFSITEIMNTILDVNLALIFPAGYTLYLNWHKTQLKANVYEKRNEEFKEARDYICVKVDKAIIKISPDDIHFIESLKNYVKIKTADRQIITYSSISSMEKTLPVQFIRVHRSYIINTNNVRSFSPKKLILQGKEIPIGRTYKERVKEKLGYF